MLSPDCKPHGNGQAFMVFREVTSLAPMPKAKAKRPEDLERGRRVAEARKALDLTQQALAALVPCDFITISRIETGVSKITPRMARLLAVSLKRSQEWIMGGAESVEDEPDRDPYPLRRELRTLSIWRQAAPEVRRYLLDVRLYAKDLPTIDDWIVELRRAERLHREGQLPGAPRDDEEPIEDDDD